jgi:TfoX/Sxy family transcriptional regulator of competence genes
MAYDEVLAERAREVLSTLTDFAEMKMFGGLAFMVNTRMACGVLSDDLMVRVGRERHDAARSQGAREMDFTGRPMRGMVMVGGESLDDEALAEWVRIAVEVAQAEPPRPPKPSRSKPAQGRNRSGT